MKVGQKKKRIFIGENLNFNLNKTKFNIVLSEERVPQILASKSSHE